MGLNPFPQNSDFTEDDTFARVKKEIEKGEEISKDTKNDEPSASAKKKKDSKKLSSSDNPLMALNELKPQLEWTCSQTGNTPATNKFHMRTEIDGQVFEGQGVSKKLAKQAAAKSILNKLYDMNFSFSGDNSIEGNTDSEMKVSVCK